MTNAPTTRETADHIGEANEKVADHIGDATTMIDHAELAACPFCGGAAKSETLGHGKSARTGVKCADVDCPGSMRLVGADEDGVAFWNRRPREAALLSEIAALRGEVERSLPSISFDGEHAISDHRRWLARQLLDSKLDDGEAYSIVAYHPAITDLRTTQAERQRDEAVGLLTDWAGYGDFLGQKGSLPEKTRAFLANQGADQ